MLFMNELDGDDGLVRILGTCFADEGIGAAAYRPRNETEWEIRR